MLQVSSQDKDGLGAAIDRAINFKFTSEVKTVLESINISLDKSALQALFEPEAVAVFGSLRESVGSAYGTIQNMLSFGYKGMIYPINPNASQTEVFGFPAYYSVDQLENSIDLAVVITPPQAIPGIVEQCARKGIKTAIILSEGFSEASHDGAELQRQIVEISHRTGIRIVGPNTYGVINTANGLATLPFYADKNKILRGGIAYCSQTGSVSPHNHPMQDHAYPVSKMCDFGNKCDINEVDLLNYFADDPDTRVVAMHLEDVKDGRKFMEAARRLTAHKPLVILKTARSVEGAKASASHTGSLAGSDRIFDAALRQVGAIRVNTWQEFWEIPKVLASQPVPKGNRVAILTFSGGTGIVATDAAIEAGLEIAKFTPDTNKRLAKLSPRLASNPVDLGPLMGRSENASSANPFAFIEEPIAAAFDDPNVDCVAVSHFCARYCLDLLSNIVEMFERVTHKGSKPVSIWIHGTDLSTMEEMARQLSARGLPAYLDLEITIKALGIAATYSKHKESLLDELVAGDENGIHVSEIESFIEQCSTILVK